MKRCSNFEVKIFVGQKQGYRGPVQSIEAARDICQKYCDGVGLCVTLTPTTYIYKDGNEPGFVVGLINYPRFVALRQAIEDHAIKLAWALKTQYEQHRVTIQTPTETIMLEDGDDNTESPAHRDSTSDRHRPA